MIKEKKNKGIISVILFIIVIGYLVLILSRSLWQNYQVNSEVEQLEERVAELKEKNQRLKNLVIYYQTDSYLEKEARRKLLMKEPEERVLALPEVEYSHDESNGDNAKELEDSRQETKEPNYQKWIEYVFG